jgi:hypothetical protein
VAAGNEATSSNQLQEIKNKISNEKHIVKAASNSKSDVTGVLGQMENLITQVSHPQRSIS